MRYFTLLALLAFTTLSFAQDDSLAIPDSGILGLKASLNRLLGENKIDSALLYTGKLVRYYQNEGNPYEELRAVTHKAEILRHISSLVKAKNLMLEYAAYADSMELSTVKSVYYNRLAAILFELDEKESALAAVRRSQKIDSIEGLTWRKYSNWNLEGAIYRDLKKFKQSRSVLERSLLYAKEHNDTNEYFNALYNLSQNYYRAKDFKRALSTSLTFLNSYPYKLSRMPGDVAETGAKSAKALGKYKQAYNLLDSAYKFRMDDMQAIIGSRVEAMKMTEELERARMASDILRSQKKADRFRILALGSLLLIALL